MKYPYSARIYNDDEYVWRWAVENLVKGTWMKTSTMDGGVFDYWFTNEEDIIAFRLKFPTYA